MKYYTIIGGVNGVGKSSLTGVLKKQRTDMGMIIDTDMRPDKRRKRSCPSYKRLPFKRHRFHTGNHAFWKEDPENNNRRP